MDTRSYRRPLGGYKINKLEETDIHAYARITEFHMSQIYHVEMRLFKRYNLCLLFLLLAREGSIRSTSKLSSQDVRDDKVHGDFLED